jgi:hypothetical protein
MNIVVAIGNLYRHRADLKIDVECAQKQSNLLREESMMSLQDVVNNLIRTASRHIISDG